MKVVLINGSPHRKGNTFIALSEVAGALEKERCTNGDNPTWDKSGARVYCL